MKYYIALGGIGCRIVRRYAEIHNIDKSQCFYIDVTSDACVTSAPEDQVYTMDYLSCGTGTLRQIGKNIVRYEIYSNHLYPFFRGILDDDDPYLVIVASSFGGFGSSASTEIAEYLESLLWEKKTDKQSVFCKIIAFNEAYFRNAGFPPQLLDRFHFNTIETAAAFSLLNAAPDESVIQMANHPIFNPVYNAYLIDTAGLAERDFHNILDKSDAELRELDVKKSYLAKPAKIAPSVFISYSSLDQKIADILADKLGMCGITCWIATRNIHEGSYAQQIIEGIRGAKIFIVLLSRNSIASDQVKNEIDRAFSRLKDNMKIVPFIIDEAELDDECSYYLCRQEFFFGKKPPIEARIDELVSKIQNMLA